MGHALRLGRTRSVTACVVLAVALLFAASPTADAARFIGHISEPVSWAFLAKCVPLGRRLARPGPVEPARPFGSGSRRWRPEFETSSLRADPTRATAPRRFCFLPADAGILAKEVQGMIQTKIKFHVRLPARPPGRPRSPAPNLRACRTPISDISPSRELTSPGATLRVRRTPPPPPPRSPRNLQSYTTPPWTRARTRASPPEASPAGKTCTSRRRRAWSASPARTRFHFISPSSRAPRSRRPRPPDDVS